MAHVVINLSCRDDYNNFKKEIENITDVTFSEETIKKIKESGIYYHITGALQPLVKKAPLLQAKQTNNKAECFMNILARFTAGKRLNLVQRKSFQTRTLLSGFRYNKGVKWHVAPWHEMFKKSPSKLLKKFIEKYKNNRKNRVYKRKGKSCKKKLIFTNDTEYGPNAIEPELSENEINAECIRLLENLQVTEEEHIFIEKQTVGQFENETYVLHRKNRLTASNFGVVIKRKKTTLFQPLVKRILYSPKLHTKAIMFGKTKECIAKLKFEQQTGLKVTNCGLFIDIQNGYLAATPDGLVEDGNILEIKCLYSLYDTTCPWPCQNFNERPYKCKICKKEFTQSGHLKVHNRSHTNERPYKCEICDKAFTYKGHLKEHIRIHTNERPYKCEICDKAFIRSGDLKVHICTHTNEKPYKCEICERTFMWSGHLKQHVRSHAKKKPDECQIKNFSSE